MKIFNKVKAEPDRLLAICDDGRRLFNRDLLREAEWIGGNVGHELVFILCRNTPGSLLGYLGCLQSGAVPLLLESGISAELLKNLVEIYGPEYLYMPEQLAEEHAEILGKESAVLHRTEDYVLISTGKKGPQLHEDLRLLLTTSGSTGSPKLVRLSGDNLDANAASIVEYLEITEKERPVTMLPMNYSYGMSVIHSHVMTGAPLILTSYTIMEPEFWQRVREEGVTSLTGIPYTYRMLDRLKLRDMELPSLRTLTQAGGKLTEELHRKFGEWALETGRHFFVMYGQTEAAPRMGYLPADRTLEKCGSMGIAIPGGRLELLDTEGKILKESDTVGELVYYGDNVSFGYAVKKEDLALGDERKGVLVTGDMAKRDADGFFYIVGRKKRFLKILGKRVNMDETERLASSHFQGAAVACVGKDDLLCIYTEEGEEVLPDIRRDIAMTTGLPENLIRIHHIDRIPKNESGKTSYKDMPVE